MNILLVILLLLLLSGGGGYYFVPGPWNAGGPNHLIGLILTILVVALLLRVLGIY